MPKPKKNKGYPIAGTIFIIVLVGFLFMVGNATCESFDEGRPFTLFGIIATVGIFVVLVVIVRALMKGDGSEEE